MWEQYLAAAGEYLATGEVNRALPALSTAEIDLLIAHAVGAALSTPYRGRAVMVVLDAALREHPDLHLRSRVAWHLARAGNACFDVSLVTEPLSRVEAGFAELQDRGWLAACVWQRNALPWTRPSFAQAVEALAQARADLDAYGLAELEPYCRLTLAYSLLLTVDFGAAAEHLAAARAAFEQRGDQPAQAQAWLVQSSLDRRQGRYARAVDSAEKCRALCQTLAAEVGLARALEHQAIAYLLWQKHALAEPLFQDARQRYRQAGLLGFEAACLNGLAQVYNQTGRFRQAAEALAQARDIFEQLGWPGGVADNCLDSGILYLYGGFADESLAYFQKAETLYKQLTFSQHEAVSHMYQGLAWSELGQYQLALRCLEKADQELTHRAEPTRFAELQLALVKVWRHLGHEADAQRCLARAEPFFVESGQLLSQVLAHLEQARGLLLQKNPAAALSALTTARTLAQANGFELQLLDLARWMGETLRRLERLPEALALLQEGLTASRALDLRVPQAQCHLGLAACYEQMGQWREAQAAWSEALALSGGILPEIGWQAHGGLARAAEQQAQTAQALAEYAAAMQALLQIRRGFTQAELVSAYLETPQPMMTRAVYLAAANDAGLTPAFIEEGKAQLAVNAFQRTLRARNEPSAAARRLEELRATIQWHQARWAENRAAAAEHQPKIQQLQADYLKLLTRLERADAPLALARQPFDLTAFRRAASARLGDWVALDWWDGGEKLVGVMVTPDDVQVWVVPVTDRLRFALQMTTQAARYPVSAEKDWRTLGEQLLPAEVWRCLTPETTLVIAPHGRLHRLAWPAVIGGEADAPLARQALPVLTPSWHSLQLLWARQTPPHSAEGLMVAITDFDNRYEPLPQVWREIQAIPPDRLARALVNGGATWATLQALSQAEQGLQRYNFWHVATHGQFDPVSGRQSGFVLADGDVWLDQLWELAPLPGLVTFSACSGAQQLVVGGGEQVGLPLTCLAAGAQTVVGSLWGVLDADSAELMSLFYAYYLAGHSPARALAYAQRQAWQEETGGSRWDSFVCLGCP